MKTENHEMRIAVIKMLIVLLCAVFCLIGTAWIHDIFLIGLALFTIGLCIWVLWRFYIMYKENSEAEQRQESIAHELEEMQIQRENLWQDILTHHYHL